MKNLNYLVSVIVPAYNHERYVSDCIESIINQDYDNIELIILNDGSTDNTYDKILKYHDICEKRFKKFQIINKGNEGVSKTLNKGLSLCSGEYICFIASDDVMMEGRIKKQVEFMSQNKSLISCGNSLFLKDNQKTDLPVINEKLKTQYFEGNQFYNLIINYYISSPTVMVKKTLIDEIGYFNENYKIEDWPYYAKILNKTHIDFLDEYLCYYRIHESNTQTNKKNMFIEEKRIIMKFFEMYKLPLSVKRKALSELYIRNRARNKGLIGKFKDIIISQIYYFDIYRIINCICKKK